MDENYRHAYLIIAHNNFEQLAKLISLLDYSKNDIYLHVDRRSAGFETVRFNSLCKHSNLFIFREYKVYWGDYSQIEVELFLFKQASKIGYSFYHLISGSDLPLRNQSEIHEFYNLHSGENFIQICKAENQTPEIARRAKYYRFFLKQQKTGALRKCFVFLDRVLLVFQMLFKIDRLRKYKFKIYYGSNWCDLTHDRIVFIVAKSINKKSIQ